MSARWIPAPRDYIAIFEMARDGMNHDAIAAQFKINARTIERRRKVDPLLDLALVTGRTAWLDALRAARPHDRGRYIAGCRCDECREANRAYSEKLRTEPIPSHLRHGRNSMYVNYGCRCPDCSAANSAYQRGRWAARKQATA